MASEQDEHVAQIRKEGQTLLSELIWLRHKIVAGMTHPQNVGNLEEKYMEDLMVRLAMVQSCIQAVDEARQLAKSQG